MVQAVDFEDDPLTVRQQEQEIHPEPQQGIPSAFADCLRVPVQPYLGQERRKVAHGRRVDLVVEGKQVPLRG